MPVAVPDPVEKGAIVVQSAMDFLADYANSKTKLGGKPYAFLPPIFVGDGTYVMTDNWLTDSGTYPGGIAVRTDVNEAYQLMYSPYSDENSWTKRDDFTVCDTLDQLRQVHIAGDGTVALGFATDQMSTYRWDSSGTWSQYYYHGEDRFGPTGPFVMGRGGWRTELARLRSEICKQIFPAQATSSFPFSTYPAGSFDPDGESGEGEFHRADGTYHEPITSRCFSGSNAGANAFTDQRYSYSHAVNNGVFALDNFRDVSFVYPGGVQEPQTVKISCTMAPHNIYTLRYSDYQDNFRDTAKTTQLILKGNWVGTSLRPHIKLKVGPGWLASLTTPPDITFTDSLGLAGSALWYVVSGKYRGIYVDIDIDDWDGSEWTLTWHINDSLWFWKGFEVPNGTPTFEFVTDSYTNVSDCHVHSTSDDLREIKLPVLNLPQSGLRLWQKFKNEEGDPWVEWDSWDCFIQGPTYFSAYPDRTDGYWLMRPRPLTGISCDRKAIPTGGGRTIYGDSVLARFATATAAFVNGTVFTDPLDKIQAPFDTISQMVGFGFAGAYCHEYWAGTTTAPQRLAQWPYDDTSDGQCIPKGSMVYRVDAKRVNWWDGMVFNGTWTNSKTYLPATAPNGTLLPIDIDLGHIRNGDFEVMATAHLEADMEGTTIYPEWINMTSDAIVYKGRYNGTRVPVHVSAMLSLPDPQMLGGKYTPVSMGAKELAHDLYYGDLRRTPYGYYGGTPILASHFNDTAMLLESVQ